MALELKGEYQIDLAREQVWILLNDPQVLAQIIPGCNSLDRINEDQYRLGLKLLVGSVNGSYDGSVSLSEKNPPDNYRLRLTGEGSIGFVKGEARFELKSLSDSRTEIAYDGVAEVGGVVAGVGNRVLGGVAKFMVKRFFNAFEKYVKENGAPSVQSPGAGSPASAGVPAPVNADEMTLEANGNTFRVRVEGRQDKPWLVLSHSIATDLHVWDRQIAALQDDFRILRFDTRGHGGSGVGDIPYSFSLLVQDVIGLLDRLGIERAHFAGVSLGGMIGYGVALAHPERLHSLIAVDSRADAPAAFQAPWDARIATAQEQGMAALEQPTLQRWFAAAYLDAHPEVAEQIGGMIRHTPVAGFEGCARALQQLDYLPQVAQIKVPVLLVSGERDGSMPDDMRQIQALIPGAEFALVPDAGHLPNVENAPAFNLVLSRFLQQAGE